MNKLAKITLLSLVAAICVFFAALFALTSLIDPNHFRDLIGKQVLAHTGRTLTIKGDLRWRLLPWLNLQVNDIVLSNAPGFGSQPFATAKAINLTVALWPLLAKQVIVKDLALTELDLSLIKNQAGVTNWQDLTQLGADKAKPANPGETTALVLAAAAFNIDAVNVTNSHVTLMNQQENTKLELRNWSAHSKNINLDNKPFNVTTTFDFNDYQAGLKGNFALTSTVAVDSAKSVIKLTDYQTKITLADPAYQQGKLALSAQTNLEINLAQQTLSAPAVQAKVGSMAITGNLAGEDILAAAPTVRGQFTVPNFNLRRWLLELGQSQALTNLAQTALYKAAAKFTLAIKPGAIALNAIEAQVDQTHLTGNLLLLRQPSSAYQFDLALDKINLNNYLPVGDGPKHKQVGIISSAEAAPANARNKLAQTTTTSAWRANGHVQAREVIWDDVALSAVQLNLSASPGLMHFNPIQARFYQGTYSGDITIDSRGQTPRISAKQSLANIQAGPFLRDFAKFTRVQASGLATVQANLTMAGENAAELKRSLTGPVKVNIKNGVLYGINIPYYFRLGIALAKRQALPAAGPNQTEFGNLTGTMSFNNGIGTNNDLLVQSPNLRVNGQGSVNLMTEQLDYLLSAQLLRSDASAEGFAVPIRVSGPFSKPAIAPDVAGILKLLLQQQLQKQGDKLKAQVADALDKNLPKNLGNLGDQLKKGLNLDKLF